MRLLALETATDRGSFCLWSDASGISKTVDCPAGQPHAETLLPLLRGALAELGWALPDLDAIVYDAGPGMFTGLRVSAALAQGLAVALDKPLVAVSSLEVLAEAAWQQNGEQNNALRVLTLLDARMNQLYTSAWQRQPDGTWQADFPACLVNPDALNALAIPGVIVRVEPVETRTAPSCCVAGTALTEYPGVAQWCAANGLPDSGVRHPTADALARVGAGRFAQGEIQDPADAVPVYVRDRVALTTAERLAGETL